MRKITLGIIVCLYFINTASAQKEYNQWWFGITDSACGMDFNSTPPVFLENKKNPTYSERVSLICDKRTGKLLIFSDDNKLVDSEGILIKNGSGIEGSSTATQASVIISKKYEDSTYYIITNGIDDLYEGSLKYSIVDFKKNNRKGEVVVKNIFLHDAGGERLTAIKKCDNSGYWIVYYDDFKNQLLSFSVDADSVTTVPIISDASMYDSDTSLVDDGQLKFSPDGKIAALESHYLFRKISFFHFDKIGGNFTPYFEIAMSADSFFHYGVSFSPDSKKFYFGTYQFSPFKPEEFKIYQLDLTSGVPATILASQTLVVDMVKPAPGNKFNNYRLMGHQLAPDGKVYISKTNGDSVACINYPNLSAANCGFVRNQLLACEFKMGLSVNFPNNIDALYSPDTSFHVNFNYSIDCHNKQVQFSNICRPDAESVIWDFGDKSAGSKSISYELSPAYTFSSAGTYHVSLWAYKGCTVDSFVADIVIPENCDGIEEVNGGSYRIYPNPAVSSVTIEYQFNDKQNKVLRFADVLGRIMKKVTLNGGARSVTVSVSDLPAGLYFYNIENKGHNSIKGKIVITR